MARASTPPRHALAAGLKALGPKHRRAVAEAIGAARDTPEAIAAVLLDEEALESIVKDLDDAARLLVTQTAFVPAYAWSSGGRGIELQVAQTLERHGLLFTFETGWGISACTPLDLERPLQRIRARAHAVRVPEAQPAPDWQLVHVPEQLLHDAVQIAAVIGAGGIKLKTDGDLFARAVPKLLDVLAPLPTALAVPDSTRLDLALRVLEENGALRVGGQALPGGPAKRELVLALDVPTLLDVPAEARAGLMDALYQQPMPGREVAAVLLDAFAGRTVALDGLGAAVARLFAEACKQPPGHGVDVPDDLLGLAAVSERWLRGDVGLIVDGQGMPTCVVFAPAATDEATGPSCLAQADFELVAMRPLTPGERAALLCVAEPVPGREHVARITKARVQGALRATGDLDVLGRLRALAGTLPQNVEQTVQDWAEQVPPRVRLRTAMMLSAPDVATAERLASALGRALVERLSPTLLAIDAGAQAAVAKAVCEAGVELEEGLDRVSGVWAERPVHETHPSWWRPTPPADRPQQDPPTGRIASRLEWQPEPVADLPRGIDPRSRAAVELARLLAQAGLDDDDIANVLNGDDLDAFDDDDDDGVDGVLLDAQEQGSVVRLKYAGAGGLRQEWVTVAQLEEARVQVRDHATGKRSWRWLRSISEAELVR